MSEEKKGKGRVLPKKQFSLREFKAENGLNDNVKDKELEWIPLSKGFQEVTGFKGIPKGYLTLVRGYSNTGKSTTILECMVSCMEQGIVPIFIDTENHFNWQHARVMGLEYEEIVDEETGEVINYEGEFIYINGTTLVEQFTKKRNPKRRVPSIEDIAYLMNYYLDLQESGKLPRDICFLWDSIGTVDCEKSLESAVGNAMWNAAVMGSAFNSVINFRIPASKKESSPYTNTIVAVQKVWFDSMSGAGVIKHKGGEAWFSACRLIFHFGGIQSHGTKKLYATSGGREYMWGTQAKFDVGKNHVNGISFKGDIISTPHGFISASKESVDKYKKEHKEYLMKMVNSANEADLEFKEEDHMDKKVKNGEE
jgi:hypothetical protein